MAKTEYTFTTGQMRLPDSPKADYGGRWAIWLDGKPVRSNGRDGDLITFATEEEAAANFEWAAGAIARGDSLYAARTKRAEEADRARGIMPPPPPPTLPKGAKTGRA